MSLSPSALRWRVADSDSLSTTNSVATTSTKSVSVLSADIQRTLERIGLRYRPIKGGFECIHVPSIDLSTVLSPAEATAALGQEENGQMKEEPGSSKRKSPASKHSMESGDGGLGKGGNSNASFSGGQSGSFTDERLIAPGGCSMFRRGFQRESRF